MAYNPLTNVDRLRDLSDRAAQELADLFDGAERDITARILDGLAKGNNTDHLANQAREIDQILKALGRDTSEWLSKALPDLYAEGQGMADQELGRYGVDTTQLPWNGPIHIEAVKVLSEAIHGRLTDSISTVGRQTNDIFRALALENIKGTAIGYQSWQNVAKTYRESLRDRGITGFVAKNGTRWNLSTYAKMVARTSTMEVALNAQANRLLEHGVDLVEIDSHYFGADSPCDLCSPWQGRVISLTGATEGYPTMAEARAAGLFHPNCRHVFSMVISLDDEIAKLKGEAPKAKAESTEIPPEFKTTQEAEEWARTHLVDEAYKVDKYLDRATGAVVREEQVSNVSYRGLKPDMANQLNRTLSEQMRRGVPRFRTIKATHSKDGWGARASNTGNFQINTRLAKSLDDLRALMESEQQRFAELPEAVNILQGKTLTKPQQMLLAKGEKVIKYERLSTFDAPEDLLLHEIGHHVAHQGYRTAGVPAGDWAKMRLEAMKELVSPEWRYKISALPEFYSVMDVPDEFWAEAFVLWQKGRPVPPLFKQMMELVFKQ